MLVSDFKDALKSETVSDIVTNHLLSPGAEKVPDEKIALISERICTKYGLASDTVKIHIVGSAKLGFSLVKKTSEDGTPLPRFRPFTLASDIDVAVVSPVLFMRIWSDLSFYANAQPEMPWVHGHLGNYLLYGWLRPDHFPHGSKVASCRSWWELFGNLTAKEFGGRKVRGGLFINKSLLHAYQKRAVVACKDYQ